MLFTFFLVQASVNSSHKPGGKGHQQTDERLGPPDCPRSRTGECSNKGLGWGGGYLKSAHIDGKSDQYRLRDDLYTVHVVPYYYSF